MRNQTKALITACGAHGIQDGLVAIQYVLYPILVSALGLTYAQVGILRAITNTAMSLFEVPSGLLAGRVGIRLLLVFGLACAGLGYLGVASSTTFLTIAAFLALAGLGAAFQHSLSSALIIEHFPSDVRRRALGTYNACGDAGKLAFTGAFSVGIGAGLAWNVVITAMGAISVLFGLGVWAMLAHTKQHTSTDSTPSATTGSTGWGIRDRRRFWMISTAAALDSVVQAVFLTFIAFVLLEKGASNSVASTGVVLALIGGMVGKFVCGFMADRFGDRRTFLLIQVATLFAVFATMKLSWVGLMIALPLMGLFIQGSTTVCYGAISDVLDTDKQSRGYSLMYTLGSVASVAGPVVFGLLADTATLNTALWLLVALTAMTFASLPALNDKLCVPDT